MEPMAVWSVVLVLTYVMPGNAPDIRIKVPKASISECWADAKAFVDAGVPQVVHDHGVVGPFAGCMVKDGPRT